MKNNGNGHTCIKKKKLNYETLDHRLLVSTGNKEKFAGVAKGEKAI